MAAATNGPVSQTITISGRSLSGEGLRCGRLHRCRRLSAIP